MTTGSDLDALTLPVTFSDEGTVGLEMDLTPTVGSVDRVIARTSRAKELLDIISSYVVTCINKLVVGACLWGFISKLKHRALAAQRWCILIMLLAHCTPVRVEGAEWRGRDAPWQATFAHTRAVSVHDATAVRHTGSEPLHFTAVREGGAEKAAEGAALDRLECAARGDGLGLHDDLYACAQCEGAT